MTGAVVPERSRGDVLDGKYRLVERLGRGGFGDVWRAEELLPGGAPFREVALKLLVPDFADAARWSEEAKLLASFRHPSLVTVYAAGVLGGPVPQPFVAMELLIGDTLLDVIARRRRVPWRRVLAWARDTAAALDVIHARGVIHLDLKPANLFLSQDGALKVLDFGISRRSAAALASIPPRAPSTSTPHGRPGSSLSTSTVGRANTGITMGGPSGQARRYPHTPQTTRGIGAESFTSRRTAGGVFFPSTGRNQAPLRTSDPQIARGVSTNSGIGSDKALPSGGSTGRAIPALEAPPPAAPAADLETAAFMAERDASSPSDRPEGTSAQKNVAGTPGFMAPEIIELAEPTAATDAYSLAVCIVQLATGRLPQDVREQPESATTDPSPMIGWLSDVRGATLRGEIRDLAADPAHLPRGLVNLLYCLLAIDPAQRGVEPGSLRPMFDEVWERPYGVPDPPYAGLSPFSVEAEGTLFGRDDDITRLGRELLYEPCVVLQGPRGTGKSSLARAGLVPDLARRGADERDDWIALDIHLGEDPDRAIREALARLSPDLEEADAEALFAFCERSPVGVALVVDPLDSLADAPDELRAKTSAILAAIAASEKRPGIRLIGILGEERAAAFLETEVGGELRKALRYVSPPSASAMDDIVLAPAELLGAQIVDRDIALSDVQREMRAGDNHLPFVAIALRAWWETREESEPLGELTLRGERWRAMGGVAGALAAHADAMVAALDPALQRVADEILLRLSTTAGAPIRVKQEDLLETLGPDAARAPEVIEALGRSHIIRIERGSLEIGHPALLKAWPRLASARLRAMERLVFLERVREAAAAWNLADRPRDLLLQGPLLREACVRSAWLASGASPLERELVASSVRESRIQAAKRIAALTAAALVIVGGFLVKRAYDARQAAADAARKLAEQRAYTSEIVSKSRRTEDPFQRAAWIAEAMRRHSPDGALPLNLASAVANVPRARFLTLDPIANPTFPWDDRWLIGVGPGTALTIVDMQPADSDVIEDMNLDADPESEAFKSRAKRPKVIAIRPHADPMVERAPFSFDTSFATRSVSGEVRVFRLRANGTVALAAIAPFHCASSMHLAAAAPVLACATHRGIARWDLRRASEGAAAVDRHGFLGTVLDVSPDGARVAATVGRKILLWEPHDPVGKPRESVTEAKEPILFARYSPRERAVALVYATSFEVVAEDHPDKPLIAGQSEPSPASARWDKGGLDLSICNATGGGDWHYLRNGIRPQSEPAPEDQPCAPPKESGIVGTDGKPKAPPPRLGSSDVAQEIAGRDLGTHSIAGGYRLSGGRVVTRDLVLFSGGPPVGSLLRFRGVTAEGADDPVEPGESAASALRLDAAKVAFQIGGEVRIYDASTGKRERSRKGNILRHCDDGRLLAWTAAKEKWLVFDALKDEPGVPVAREPGLVLGADASCSTLLTQRLDGSIIATRLPPPGAGVPADPIPAGRSIAIADGYIYAVSPSPARPPFGSALWLAASSCALARYDDRTGVLRLVGRASPRATAIGDGPYPGELAYADATGVMIRRLGGQVEQVLAGLSGESWEDLSVAPDGATMLLCTGERISVLDIGRREIAVDFPADGRSRFSNWDADGSVLTWTFDRIGGAEGQIIPRGLPLATRVAEEASNLRVENRRLVAKP